MLETMIVIGAFAYGVGVSRSSMDVYDSPKPQMELGFEPSTRIIQGNADIPSFIPWAPTSSNCVQQLPFRSEMADIIAAFREIDLSPDDGLDLLDSAKMILANTGFSDHRVIPVFARDPEEDVAYLTLRIHVNASFEKTLELDSSLTRSLVRLGRHLPERLSFAVYESADLPA